MDRISKHEPSYILRTIQGCILLILSTLQKGIVPFLEISKYKFVDDLEDEQEECVYELSSETEILSLILHTTSRRFVSFFRILEIVQELLIQKKHATKRDVYYTDVNLFKDQRTVDRALIDACIRMNTTRYDLNIVSPSKGLVMGSLRFFERNCLVNCSSCVKTGIPIPTSIYQLSNVSSDAKYILVVEKETAFLRLADDEFCLKNPCIVITGRGYPDMATRMFLNFLNKNLNVSIFGICDFDPYGMDILSTYRFGSMTMAHDAANLSVPSLKWIGVFVNDVKRFHLSNTNDRFLPLTKADVSKAKRMLERAYFSKVAPKWMSELENMLECGLKMEIEAITSEFDSFFSDVYVPSQIRKFLQE